MDHADDEVEMEVVDNDDDNDENMGENSDDDNDDSSDGDGNESNDKTNQIIKPQVYLPGKPLDADEELVCDESAYVMLHQAKTGAPCLSFDIVRDQLGENRDAFPLSCYIVAGTQAAKAHVNNVIVMKMSNLHRTSKDNEDNSESESDDDEDDDDEEQSSSRKQNQPQMDCALIKHGGCVNRIRATTVANNVLAATWSELGRVNIWNISDQLLAIDDRELLSVYQKEGKANNVKSLFTFSGHQQEGYAIDWSPVAPGCLATGDCRRDIHIWKPHESGTWNVDQRPLIGHTESVEDLQWSPNEASVLASCSVDKSIRIWDIRAAPNKACMLTCENAHSMDINVMSWNRTEPFIASGGDDGVLHIWDLRQFQTKTPIATFKHHTKPITTVEWHPTDSTVLATGGADDQIALWDLAVEKDAEATAAQTAGTSSNGGKDDADLDDLPPQLLFIHQGQSDIKELHWHPQMPGVILSTAHSGFNVFKTISV